MPASLSSGITTSLKTRVLLVDQRMRGGAIASSSRSVVVGPGRRAASRQSAKRTSKNSSRLEETMQT